jgi:hypothetical protein
VVEVLLGEDEVAEVLAGLRLDRRVDAEIVILLSLIHISEPTRPY